MAMENLLRIANRTEDLPDQALAQLAKAGGIEGVIAASEMKARSDIRKDAQMPQQGQMPPVVDQLINMANRQAAPQMPPMGQPMPPQAPQAAPMAQGAAAGRQALMARGAPTAPSAPMPQGISPELAALAARGGIPAMQAGGLIRRFQAGSQGAIGVNQQYMDALSQFLGYDPQAILSGNIQVPSGFNLSQQQLDDLQSQYEEAMAGTDIYQPEVEAAGQAYKASTFVPNPQFTPFQRLIGVGSAGVDIPNPLTKEQTMDAALQSQRQQAATALFRQSGLPQGNIQSRTPVGSQVGVQALIPGGAQGITLPQGYGPMAAPAPAAQPSGSISNVIAAPGTTLATLPSRQNFINSILGNAANAAASGTTSGTTSGPTTSGTAGAGTISTFATPEDAVAQATGPFNVPVNDLTVAGITPYEQSPQFAADRAALQQLDSQQIKINGLQGDLLKTLQEREAKYNKEVDASVRKLADLEKDLPTRQNIKDRLKKQTSLGMAQAFFQAAGSKSPDFITAMSQGLAGAAGVMNKMTGEEQKELYAHALAEYQREQGKANTAFKRQENAMKKITDAQTFQATLATSNKTARNQLARMRQDSYYDAMRINVDVDKANQKNLLETYKISADEYKDFRTERATAAENRNKVIETAYSTEQSADMKPEQRILQADIANSYAQQYVRGAQQNINSSIERIVKDLSREFKKLEKQIPDPAERMQAARALLEDRMEEENLAGDRAVLDLYAQDLFELAAANNSPAAKRRFYQKPQNHFINPKALGYALTAP